MNADEYKSKILKLLIDLEDNLDMRDMSIDEAVGYCKAIADVKREVRR